MENPNSWLDRFKYIINNISAIKNILLFRFFVVRLTRNLWYYSIAKCAVESGADFLVYLL